MDYATMTDAELNVQVAHYRGFSILSVDKFWHVFRVGVALSGHGSFEEAQAALPNYCGDLNAAFALFEHYPIEANVGVIRDHNSGEPDWKAFIGEHPSPYYAEADSPARAIVIAWLQWQEARDE